MAAPLKEIFKKISITTTNTHEDRKYNFIIKSTFQTNLGTAIIQYTEVEAAFDLNYKNKNIFKEIYNVKYRIRSIGSVRDSDALTRLYFPRLLRTFSFRLGISNE
jgi:hypothetical protein